MAGLAAAVGMQKKLLQEQRAEAAKDKKRFVADPCIAVNDICKSLQCFMQHHKCNDLWRLICPPQSLINVCWQTPVNPEWVVKLSGLAFDIFDFAKNTKLQSVRVKKALQALLEQKNITLPDHLGQKEDAMDSIDLKLRIGLNMYRELKKSSTLRSRVFRVLTCDEQTRIQMCLDKIIMDLDTQADTETVVASPPSLLALPAPVEATPDKSLVAVSTEPMHSFRRSLQFSPSSLQISETPAIFGQILGAKSSVEEPAEVAKAKALTDEDILQGALEFVPKQVEGKKKKKGQSGSKKNPKKQSKKKSIKNKKKQEKEAEKTKVEKKETEKQEKKKQKMKTAMKSSDKANNTAKTDVPLSPDYVIQDNPSMEDGYRNLYTSRHWHRADQLAKKCGLPMEERKRRRKEAAEEAGRIWDRLRPN